MECKRKRLSKARRQKICKKRMDSIMQIFPFEMILHIVEFITDNKTFFSMAFTCASCYNYCMALYKRSERACREEIFALVSSYDQRLVGSAVYHILHNEIPHCYDFFFYEEHQQHEVVEKLMSSFNLTVTVTDEFKLEKSFVNIHCRMSTDRILLDQSEIITDIDMLSIRSEYLSSILNDTDQPLKNFKEIGTSFESSGEDLERSSPLGTSFESSGEDLERSSPLGTSFESSGEDLERSSPLGTSFESSGEDLERSSPLGTLPQLINDNLKIRIKRKTNKTLGLNIKNIVQNISDRKFCIPYDDVNYLHCDQKLHAFYILPEGCHPFMTELRFDETCELYKMIPSIIDKLMHIDNLVDNGWRSLDTRMIKFPPYKNKACCCCSVERTDSINLEFHVCECTEQTVVCLHCFVNIMHNMDIDHLFCDKCHFNRFYRISFENK
ncbi:putative orfan [Tupanvirus soda lake]|uniref:Orfan n=2 Tax=Tupanvirus TaxID=2094720 RepID=A0AC62AD92_9VIRU|nr:putative orfan [Tupanvirus soda lake]QKU35739.1 putative orfan [Tupanvirus soda lake]